MDTCLSLEFNPLICFEGIILKRFTNLIPYIICLINSLFHSSISGRNRLPLTTGREQTSFFDRIIKAQYEIVSLAIRIYSSSNLNFFLTKSCYFLPLKYSMRYFNAWWILLQYFFWKQKHQKLNSKFDSNNLLLILIN